MTNKPRPPGRPVRNAKPADIELRVRVTPDERARIEGLAERDGLSISEFVRRRALDP